jgi:hypothetical protein
MNAVRRSKDKPNTEQFRDRLEREFYRLINDLSFCYELLARRELLAPEVDADRAEVKSVHNLFKSCEECAISATARLWETSSDAISLPNTKSIISDLWKVNSELPSGFEVEWQTRNQSVSTSETRSRLLVLRDEEFGHNIIDSGKRLQSDELMNLGLVGRRGFGSTNGEVLTFCKETALLLFQTIAPFSENPALVENYEVRFKIKFNAHREYHAGLLKLL